MIVSWNWLKEYVRLDMPIDELLDRLLMSGLSHEGVEDVEGDIAIDLEVTSNRPDCLGHVGVAREVAALFAKELQLPPTTFVEEGEPIGTQASVVVEPSASAWCRQYRARVIRDVVIGPSPTWLQRRLRAIGQKPINNVVDVTNYVLHECGQPLHAFDYDKLVEKRIVVRDAFPGEKFLAINNREYPLEPAMGVIADASQAVALAGVMGGANTEVGDATTTVLLESAEFAVLPIRRASRSLDLSSDSSYRFERKIDPAGVAWASDRACHLICELAQGKVAPGFIHVGESDFPRDPIRLRWPRVRRILGVDVPREEIADILRRLGLTIVSETADGVSAVPPTFRRDLTREIDLIEEIGRIHGYADLPEDNVIPLAVAGKSQSERVIESIRDTLCSCGYFEAITFSFTDAKALATVRPWSRADALKVRHSSRKQENHLRQSLLPSLLGSLQMNEAQGNADAQLFEVAQIFLPKEGAPLPDEPRALGLVSFRDPRVARGHVEAMLSRLGIASSLHPTAVQGLAAGKSAEYRVGSERVGVFGVVDSAVADAIGLRSAAVVAEFLIEPLIAAAQLARFAQPIPELPAVVRDFAFVLDEPTTWAELESVTRDAAGACLESLEFVDLYRGAQVPPGKKSIALRLTYRAADRTLTREEVDEFQQNVLHAVASKFGGTLR